jgi:hypothetical protein
MFVYYELSSGSLNVQPFVGPNMNATKIRQVIKPLTDQLVHDSIPHDLVVKDFPTFFELYIDLFSDEGAGANMLVGGRLFSKTDIRNNGDGIVDAIRQALNASQSSMIGHIVGPGTGAPVVDNAVHPTWRDGASFSISTLILPTNITLAEKAAAQTLLTNEVDAPLRAASPNGAAYVNEVSSKSPWNPEDTLLLLLFS